MKQLRLSHGAEIVSEDAHMTGAGFEQAGSQFKDKSLARSGFADEDLSFLVNNAEGESTKNVALVKAEAHILKGNDWLVRGGVHPGEWLSGGRQHMSSPDSL